jgi:hypothetical protein
MNSKGNEMNKSERDATPPTINIIEIIECTQTHVDANATFVPILTYELKKGLMPESLPHHLPITIDVLMTLSPPQL